LTPAKEKTFTEWVRLHKEKMLSRGEYLGELYDIGFDRPETHAVRKGDCMYSPSMRRTTTARYR
jgi:alpha-galactosidase